VTFACDQVKINFPVTLGQIAKHEHISSTSVTSDTTRAHHATLILLTLQIHNKTKKEERKHAFEVDFGDISYYCWDVNYHY
jgi:hypothetical protein